MSIFADRVPIVRLYTAASCSLCEEAKAELIALAPSLAFRLEVVPLARLVGDLRQAYRDAVPVVTLEGREIARAPITKGSLETRLRAALRPA